MMHAGLFYVLGEDLKSKLNMSIEAWAGIGSQQSPL